LRPGPENASERKGKMLDALIVDHMHITRASDRYAGNPVRETTEISGALKALAKELNIPVIALAQLSRKVEERDNKRPTLSDLQESGAIEQDADLVALVFREAIYILQQRLGHTSVKTTEIYLAYLTPEEKQHAMFGASPAGTKTGTNAAVENG
jgi:replicative DNA helicase